MEAFGDADFALGRLNTSSLMLLILLLFSSRNLEDLWRKIIF